MRNPIYYLTRNTRKSVANRPFSYNERMLNRHPKLLKVCFESLGSKTIVCDIHGTLLRSKQSFFPYFMIVAFEAGSILRAFLLLSLYPMTLLFPFEIKLRVMIFVTFCGLKLKEMDRVQRAVLPKFYLEDLNCKTYELLASAEKRVIFTIVPKVMVEGFLKEYLKVDHVSGTELHHLGSRFTGLLTDSGLLVKHKALKQHFGEEKPDRVVGFGCASALSCLDYHDLLLLSYCKEAFVVSSNSRDNNHQHHIRTSKMERKNYPKPLIFHDGRLVFLPTPFAAFSMFMWLPFAIFLSIVRVLIGSFLPHKLVLLMCCFTGIRIRFSNRKALNDIQGSHVLYVCNHRTLLDPLYLRFSLGKPLTAVTYSISKLSELLAPIKTERLTRDRNRDREKIRRLLSEGDLVVCPEGTTCREPYLLRFSPLFAEVADDMVPVAMDTEVTMFYGNTARGLKAMDPFFFMMNPRPTYFVNALEKVPKELTCGGGGKSRFDVANHIQRRIGEVLGFECTSLTRKDKYMLLAGNQGLV